eukprot:3106035-Ditylum_brightwellii.AAC.1
MKRCAMKWRSWPMHSGQSSTPGRKTKRTYRTTLNDSRPRVIFCCQILEDRSSYQSTTSKPVDMTQMMMKSIRRRVQIIC